MMPQDLHKHFVLPQIRAYLDMLTRSYHPPFVNKPEQATMQENQNGREPYLEEIITDIIDDRRRLLAMQKLDDLRNSYRQLSDMYDAVAANPLSYWAWTRLVWPLRGWYRRIKAELGRRAPLWLVTFWLKLQLFLYAVANPRGGK